MDKEIVDFVELNKVATIACAEGGIPYCFNCYYSFIENEGLLIYKSSYGTRHEEIMQVNKSVAGTIIPEQIEVAVIKGIQFQGMQLNDNFDIGLKASASYYLKFPFAMAVPGKLYVIELHEIKFTDNTRGFGFKQHWKKSSR
jgi:uncharacterized protein YhbP (UPF0306 family)